MKDKYCPHNNKTGWWDGQERVLSCSRCGKEFGRVTVWNTLVKIMKEDDIEERRKMIEAFESRYPDFNIRGILKDFWKDREHFILLHKHFGPFQ